MRLLVFLFALSASLYATDKPNIVVIVADDLGYADLTFNPQHPKEIVTPNLDSLAKQGVICRQGYVTGHVCSPTRAGLMLGRYQQRLGLYTGGEAGSGVPMSEKLFPQYLKPAGYATGQFGKWHLGPDLAWSPALRGFDEVFGFLGRGAHDYFKLDDPNDPIYRGTEVVKETGYLTDRLGEETAAFITKHKAGPFFAYLAFNAVHAPLQAPEDEIAKFNTGNKDRDARLAMGKRMDDAIGRVMTSLMCRPRRSRWPNRASLPKRDHQKHREYVQAYLACIAFTDAQIGRVLVALDKSPYKDNTLVVLWSDHGWHHGEKEHWRKSTLWEEATRAPMIWRVPGVTKAGGVCARPVDFLGIYPTLCDLSGVPLPPHLEGVSLKPLLADPQAAWDRPAISTMHDGNHAVHTDRWRYIRYAGGGEELYDDQANPHEWSNLANQSEHAAVKAELSKWLPTTTATGKKKKKKDKKAE
jgi:arylsulfatase A-like enzyme